MTEAIVATDADATVIYVPPPFAAEAIMEAADAFDSVKGEGVIVCITEGIPTLDMVKAVAYVYNRPGVRLIGPNCPGIITPEKMEEQKLVSCQGTYTQRAESVLSPNQEPLLTRQLHKQ